MPEQYSQWINRETKQNIPLRKALEIFSGFQDRIGNLGGQLSRQDIIEFLTTVPRYVTPHPGDLYSLNVGLLNDELAQFLGIESEDD